MYRRCLYLEKVLTFLLGCVEVRANVLKPDNKDILRTNASLAFHPKTLDKNRIGLAYVAVEGTFDSRRCNLKQPQKLLGLTFLSSFLWCC